MLKVISKFYEQKINIFFEKRRILLALLFLIHLPVTYYSYFTYIKFLSFWPWYLKIFVPTCTVVLSAFTLAFLWYFLRRKVPSWLALYCVIAGVSYGMIMSLLLYPTLAYSKGFSLYYGLQIPAHFFMVLESLIFLKFVKFVKTWEYLIVLFWFLLKATSDLTFKTSSYLFRTYNFYLSEIKYYVYFGLVIFQLILFMWLYFMFYHKSKKHNSRRDHKDNTEPLAHCKPRTEDKIIFEEFSKKPQEREQENKKPVK